MKYMNNSSIFPSKSKSKYKKNGTHHSSTEHKIYMKKYNHSYLDIYGFLGMLF